MAAEMLSDGHRFTVVFLATAGRGGSAAFHVCSQRNSHRTSISRSCAAGTSHAEARGRSTGIDHNDECRRSAMKRAGWIWAAASVGALIVAIVRYDHRENRDIDIVLLLVMMVLSFPASLLCFAIYVPFFMGLELVFGVFVDSSRTEIALTWLGFLWPDTFNGSIWSHMDGRNGGHVNVERPAGRRNEDGATFGDHTNATGRTTTMVRGRCHYPPGIMCKPTNRFTVIA